MPIKDKKRQTKAARTADKGIVSPQAKIMFRATPQWTALVLLVAPTPIIDPEIT